MKQQLVNELVSFFSDDTLERRIKDKKITDKEKNKLISFYYMYFGSGLSMNCPNRFHDAFIRLKNMLKSKKMEDLKTIKERKYHLRRGLKIICNGKTYTEINLTDEVAVKFLEKHPEKKIKFSEIPKEKEIANTPTKTIEPIKTDSRTDKNRRKSRKKNEDDHKKEPNNPTDHTTG
jgi:hypothetical protein